MNRYHPFAEWATIVRTLATQVEKPGMVLPTDLCAAIAELNAACARNVNNQPEPKKHA